MTRQEFEQIEATPAIMLSDGRLGLCNHWSDSSVLIDVYGEGPHATETVRLPWDAVTDLGGGALAGDLTRCLPL
jgi:hypothetical protein